jgi:hypothetical protein
VGSWEGRQLSPRPVKTHTQLALDTHLASASLTVALLGHDRRHRFCDGQQVRGCAQTRWGGRLTGVEQLSSFGARSGTQARREQPEMHCLPRPPYLRRCLGLRSSALPWRGATALLTGRRDYIVGYAQLSAAQDKASVENRQSGERHLGNGFPRGSRASCVDPQSATLYKS